MESRGLSSGVLRLVFGVNVVFHPAMGLIVWKRLLPDRVVDLSCLLFASGVCAACMALRFYSPAYGARIDLQPLYLWIPIIYVFVFILSDRTSALILSLGILAVFVSISVPYLVRHADQSQGNFTIQLHMVSGVLIAALYFFSSYVQRSNTDELTQVANRRRMTETIESELVRHSRYARAFSIVLFDVDHFKAINDHLGHRVGDEALVALAARTRDVLREADALGRWGGDEFIVLLPETGFDETLRKAGALCREVAAMPPAGRHQITISCGVTSVRNGDTAAALLQRADVALYAAKNHGRNRVEGVLE